MTGLLSALARQFVHDLKASWVKTAVLGVLLIIGLALWVPPLIRVVAGTADRTGPEATRAPEPPRSGRPARADLSQRSDSPAASAGLSWKDADELLKTHPLLQSADAGAVAGDPFQMDYDRFAPPVLFAEEPTAENPSEPEASNGAGNLALKSTILGGANRAALINKELHYEGAEFEVDGTTYRLESVSARKVVVSNGTREIELRLADQSSSDSIQLRRIVTDDERAP